MAPSFYYQHLGVVFSPPTPPTQQEDGSRGWLVRLLSSFSFPLIRRRACYSHGQIIDELGNIGQARMRSSGTKGATVSIAARRRSMSLMR